MERLNRIFVLLRWATLNRVWKSIVARRNPRAEAGVQFPVKYWGFLAAKLAAAMGVIALGWLALVAFVRPEPFFRVVKEPFGHSLGYTILMMFCFWLAAGLLWAIIWDHRYRCRTCLKRLRMPIATGSWGTHFLFGRPRTEYICPFGHGTLKIEELQITGHSEPDWQPHEDIWKELLSLENSKK